MTNCIHDHGRWGRGDQLGAGHLLTPERTLAAMRRVKEGRIIDLSHTIEIGAPRMAPNQTPYHMQIGPTSRGSIKRRRKMGAKNDAGSNLERMELTTHVGTHIDSLGHFTYGDRMHGGYSAEETVEDFGLANLGIENCPPMITRGTKAISVLASRSNAKAMNRRSRVVADCPAKSAGIASGRVRSMSSRTEASNSASFEAN